MFWYGWTGYRPMLTAPDDAMEIEAVGQMWKWTFNYENGNTLVDTIVVEEKGAIIDPNTIGCLNEESRTNYFLNSDVPVSQAAMVTAGAVPHTVTVTGDIVATADGSANITSTVSYTFTPAATANIVIVSGTGTVQVEAGSIPTSYIPTVGSAIVRAGDSAVKYDAPIDLTAVADVSYSIFAEINLLHDAVDMTSDGTILVISNGTNSINLKLLAADGKLSFNSVHNTIPVSKISTAALIADKYKIGIRYDKDTGIMDMWINGTKEPGSVIHSAALTINTGISYVYIGANTANSAQLNSVVSTVREYTKALSDLQMEGKTA